MKIVKTFATAEIPNPHHISVRALLVSDSAQFEHLLLEAGQVQIKHVAHTNVYLYVLDGIGVLEAGEETVPLSTDMLVEMPPETPHRLINNSNFQLRLLNIKAPRPQKPTQVVEKS